ncbi:DUF2214 family protein [Neptunicella sp. SCSIO 80796]|uniref:DUF2214 family protein n=1 Tax=Neptunicella plasticusilytica TaxID=3117012 RepID=UPI003A4E56C9
MLDIFIRYGHFLGIIFLSSALFAEHLLLAREIDRQQLKKLVVVDAIFGISAGVVLIAGLLLWFYVGKPAEFYSKNFVFHIKLTLFVLMGILSIFPTMFILRQRKSGLEVISVPAYIINIVRAELLLLVLIPLLAVLMAQGYGLH